MTSATAPAGADSARPILVSLSARRWCRFLAGAHVLAGAAYTGYRFYQSVLPVTIPDEGGGLVPAWLSFAFLVALALLTLPWLLLPAPLLAAGLVHVRRAMLGGWRWPCLWVGAVAAEVALEWLVFTGAGYPDVPIPYTGPGLVNWSALAECAGFLAAGVVMAWVLVGAERAGRQSAECLSATRAGKGPAASPRRGQGLWRWCRFLAVAYGSLGAADSAWSFYQSSVPGSQPEWLPSGPGWLAGVEFLGGLDLSLWHLLPLPLLVIGLVHVLRNSPARWRWSAAWAGAVAAGIALESLPFTLLGYRFPALGAYGWGLLAQSAAFLTIGAVMLWVLTRTVHPPRQSVATLPLRSN